MKCSNCGAPVEEGQVFCLKCGKEIQWVPDYDTFGTYIEQERKKQAEKQKEEAAAAKIRMARQEEEKKKKKKKHRIIGISVSGVILLLIVGTTVIMKIRTDAKNYNDFDYQMKMADISFSNQKYEKSYEYVERALTLNNDDVDAYLLKAQLLVSLEKEEQAIALLEELVKKYPDQAVAYGQLIKLYSGRKENEKIKNLLDHCQEDAIREKYSNYISQDPIFSLPAGSYTGEKSVQLYTKDEKQKIYYTTDGSVPTETSTLYEESILLSEGSTTINAIAVNGKGISSNVISNKYEIMLPAPEAPQISPSSGKFTTDMDTSIYVIVPEGCEAYYAFDEKPTKNSEKYISGEPVQMPKGTHTFYAVLVNERGQMSYPGSMTYTLNDPE